MNPLAIDLGLSFWTLLTFAGLMFVLARYAFKPLRAILEAREQKIRESVERAEKAKQDAETILASNTAQLDQARAETRRIITEGHKIVADMRREAEEVAKKDAAHIAAEARKEIDYELRRGVDELKETVSGLSLRIARQLVKEGLDEKRHEQLVNDFVQRLKEARGPRT